MLEIAAGKFAVAAASTVLAGGAAVGINVASDCSAGQEMTAYGCATVTDAPDITRGHGTVSSVTPSSGVVFRDENGNRTNSGLSPRDKFMYVGQKMQGKGNDGTLILVKQITKGVGGWGPLYLAWIPVKYTANPGAF